MTQNTNHNLSKSYEDGPEHENSDAESAFRYAFHMLICDVLAGLFADDVSPHLLRKMIDHAAADRRKARRDASVIIDERIKFVSGHEVTAARPRARQHALCQVLRTLQVIDYDQTIEHILCVMPALERWASGDCTKLLVFDFPSGQIFGGTTND